MSLVQLRVELPTYAHSFTIQVPEVCTIRDVKQEIYTACPGSPQVSGQRIVWRGRYLSDEEKVEDLWKSPNEPRIIHLSVHPSAWTSRPPNVSRLQERLSQSPIILPSTSTLPAHNTPLSPLLAQTPAPTRTVPITSASATTASSPSPSVTKHPLTYVLKKHQHALSVLMQDGTSHDVFAADTDHLRNVALYFVQSHGYEWPAILDEPFPSSSEGGLNGKSYLNLRNPWEKPSAAQYHALKPAIHSEAVQIPPNVNAILQQLGLPPVEGGPNQLPQPPFGHGERANAIEVREINLRPFFLPLLMLTFRTLLLLYFVAPARKPVFGFLIIAWVLYEIWQPIRNGILRGWQRAVAAEEQERNGNAARRPGAQNEAPAGANAQRPNPLGVNNQGRAAVLDTFANYDILVEEAELSRGDAQEPGFRRKAAVFATLFLATVHPAVWNRRRAALRPREGRIRTEANAMNQQEETDDADLNARRAETRAALIAQHARRQPWIQNYINRVVQGEWVDDSD
uniref:Ubiquitin-like domain-containing protein n=1 Tax=Moniliophthora roreri TaxID=221103 RepID=A0A0W0FCS9_MONRR